MSDVKLIRDAAHDVRNNIHAFEMAIAVCEQADSDESRKELIAVLKNEIRDTKDNLEHLIALVESKLTQSG